MVGAMPGGARTLNPSETLDWLRLIRSENVGPITFYQLLARFGSAAAALDALPDLARRGGRSRPLAPLQQAGARSANWPTSSGRRQARRLGRAGLSRRCWPRVDDAPPLLSRAGRRRAAAAPRGRHGRRRATPRPTASAWPRPRAAARPQGLVVVSGLARGIDAAAHEGALPTGTIAVLAGGIDSLYPRRTARCTTHRRAGRGAGRGAARHRAAGPPLPAPQPHHRRPRARRGGGRGGAALRLADHRALRARSRAARCSPCRARRSTRAAAAPTT